MDAKLKFIINCFVGFSTDQQLELIDLKKVPRKQIKSAVTKQIKKIDEGIKKMKTCKKKKNVESIMIINFLTNDNEAYHLGNHAYTLKYLSGRSHRVTFGQQPLGQVTSGYGARNHQDPRHNIKNPTFRLRKIVVKIGRQPKVVKKRSAILAIAEEK